MKPYPDLKEAARRRFYDYRNIFNLIETDKFETAYVAASDPEKSVIEGHMLAGDVDAIKKWLKACGDSTAALKLKAKGLGIVNWSRLRKYELVERIEEYERRIVPSVRGSTVLPDFQNRDGSGETGLQTGEHR